jgi:hypothetical protein
MNGNTMRRLNFSVSQQLALSILQLVQPQESTGLRRHFIASAEL